MSEWLENKGRKRAPYAKGTLIDVQYRGAGISYAVECGSGGANDWAIDNVIGDILCYRLHTEDSEANPETGTEEDTDGEE